MDDVDLNGILSDAIVWMLATENSASVGLYASVAWFEPELSAVHWPVRGAGA
ncbi:hypothetical protein [Nocardia terpenica]|uniref:Uncharacterized protein n=1 Tax=Nocardia terpenica TaxID=455432 RepID=A0A6G9Z2H9_9NOCA|nr:hypothetical protein [Nocardia terpenica]QIS19213.1 hypothetical protein F6W96_13850 [Nocardia terpenica]